MDVTQLIGYQVYVRAGDIFDIPAVAVIRLTDSDSRSLLLEFAPPVQVGAQAYKFAVAHPRLEGDSLAILLSKGVLGSAVTCVSNGRYDPAKPFDLSWWRGGAAVIADLSLIPNPKPPNGR